MTTEKKIQTIAGLATALFVISLFASIYLYRGKSLLSEDLRNERLQSEKLLGEKSHLEKTIEDFKSQLSLLKSDNDNLNKVVTDTEQKLIAKEAFIKRLKIENATTQSLRKELSEIKNIRQDLINQLNEERDSNEALQKENQKLNQLLASLEEENLKLTRKLASASFTAKNFRTEVVRGKKDKLTVRAKKADKILLSFDIPNDGNDDLTQIHLSVTGKNGSNVKGKSIVKDESSESVLTASISNDNPEKQTLKRINIIFEPETALNEGIYKIVVFNGDEFLGNTQLRLSK